MRFLYSDAIHPVHIPFLSDMLAIAWSFLEFIILSTFDKISILGSRMIFGFFEKYPFFSY